MDSEELRQTNCSNETAMYAKYENPDSGMAPDSSWRTAYHGTWFYSLRNVLYHGVLLESRNTHIGHEFWEPGVYVSPKFETAREYARAHQMFNDGNYYRCVLKVVYDPDQVKKERERGGGQVVVPSCAVAIIGVIFCADDPPRKGEERFENWSDDLEVIPAKEIAKEEFIKDQREQESLQPQTSQEVQPKPEEAKVSQNSVEGSARSGRSSKEDENDEKVVEKSKEQTGLRFCGTSLANIAVPVKPVHPVHPVHRAVNPVAGITLMVAIAAAAVQERERHGGMTVWSSWPRDM